MHYVWLIRLYNEDIAVFHSEELACNCLDMLNDDRRDKVEEYTLSYIPTEHDKRLV